MVVFARLVGPGCPWRAGYYTAARRITSHLATNPERLLACTNEHIVVADAIMRGDAETAARLMREHIEAMSASALTLIRSYILPIRGERF